MAVSPVTTAYRPYASIKTHENRQLRLKTHRSCIPYCDPALDMDVTLPVPMVYPMQKIPGPTASSTSQMRFTKDDLVSIRHSVSGEVYDFTNAIYEDRVFHEEFYFRKARVATARLGEDPAVSVRGRSC